jgi:hypothetical protein
LLAFSGVCHAVENGMFADFIYIDANTEGGSGGHSAFRIGDDVYHFQQVPSGMFLLVRDRWKHFRKVYNDLENRTIYINRFGVPGKMFRRLDKVFRLHYLAQEQHLANLKALDKDRQLLHRLAENVCAVPLRGAGLFSYADDPSLPHIFFSEEELAILRKFLDSLLKRVEKFRFYAGESQLVRDFTDISSDVMPSMIHTQASEYAELVHYVHALGFILDGRKIDMNAVMDTTVADSCVPLLGMREKELLEDYILRLGKGIMELVQSDRIDIGWPLMFFFARMQAIRLSIRQGRLVLPDPFSDDADFVPSDLLEDSEVLERIYSLQCRHVHKVFNVVFSEDALDEVSWNTLESEVAPLVETVRYVKGNSDSIRVQGVGLVPDKTGLANVTCPNTGNAGMLWRNAEKCYKRYRCALKTLYGYNLFNHNCVTELLRMVGAAVGDRKAEREIFGDYIDPSVNPVFIPFVLDQKLAMNARGERIILPSYRHRMLEKRYMAGNRLLVYVMESNTLTSDIYDRIGDDRGFLFFTDDVFWLRPFYGVGNVAYGVLYAGAGLFEMPFGRFHRVMEGLDGVFFSLPELFFFNIRKGNFIVAE